MKKSKEDNIAVALRMPKVLMEQLKSYAHEHDLSVSQVVRMAIKQQIRALC